MVPRLNNIYKPTPAGLRWRARTNYKKHKLPYKCYFCGRQTRVEIHHIDGNIKNNKINNLLAVCRKHHIEYFHPELF